MWKIVFLGGKETNQNLNKIAFASHVFSMFFHKICVLNIADSQKRDTTLICVLSTIIYTHTHTNTNNAISLFRYPDYSNGGALFDM